MKGINFQNRKPIDTPAANRMDIGCFVGLIGFREGGLTPEIQHWLYRQGWLNSADGLTAAHHRDDAHSLLNVPVPVENWESFQQMFAWDRRLLTSSGLIGPSYLGVAVRSFFAQGGRKCYVIRVDDPLLLNADSIERESVLKKIIPGYPAMVQATRTDRHTWNGIGHLLGLPDVSYLSMPDLPDLVQAQEIKVATQALFIADASEQFVDCSERVPPAAQDNLATTIPAPRSDAQGYAKWQKAIHSVASFLSRHRRDVQLIAAVPLPSTDEPANSNLLNYMHQQQWLSNSIATNTNSIASAFVQLCYPWLKSPASLSLPEQLEVPDGALVGLLARNALNRGVFRSLTGLTQSDVYDLYPKLPASITSAPNNKAPESASPTASLIDRVSLYGYTNEGVGVLSDVTTSNAKVHRPASVTRTISLVVRAARILGEEFVFERNGESLWNDIRQRCNDLMITLYRLGALRGKNPNDAFYVRCDRSIMRQQQIDSGQVVAEIRFDPAASIESIDVLLSMDQKGQLSVTSVGVEETQ